MLRVHSIETFGTHDGPGIRLVLFLQGCALSCLYCHNPDTQPCANDKARELGSEEVLDLLERERPYFGTNGGLTVSGGEPTLQAAALIELFILAQARGFHLALDTSGAVWSRIVNRLYDLTDLVILDIKHIDDAWHKRLTGGGNSNPLRNAEYRERSGRPLWLRYVLVPGYTDAPHHLEAWARRFSEFQSLQRVEILPYHTMGAHKYASLGLPYRLEGVAPPGSEAIEAARQTFCRWLPNVVVAG